MARGDAESARPKTRQRLQEALDKAKSFDGVGLGGGGGMPNGVSNAMHRSFPQPEDTSFAAIRNRMIQHRMSLGSRCVFSAVFVFVSFCVHLYSLWCLGRTASICGGCHAHSCNM